MTLKDQNFLLHLLRNPSGWSDEVVREARLKAAAELERLWHMEYGVKATSEELHQVILGVKND